MEEYLDTFTGAVIVVSHDRYFLDRVVDRVFRFEGEGRIREYPGNYSAFLEIRDREAREAQQASDTMLKKGKPIPNSGVVPQSVTKSRKLSYKEKQELERLEVQIPKDEFRKKEIESALNASATDFGTINALIQEMTELNKRLDQAIIRWTELAEV